MARTIPAAGPPGMRGVGAREGQDRDAQRRHHPHCDSHRGDRHPGIGPDAAPAHVPDRPGEPRDPCPFRAAGYPPAIRHRLLSGGGAQAHDVLPQIRGQRGQRQQAGEGSRAHGAPSVLSAGLALADVPDNQVARLFGQLPVPVGQQLAQGRAGLPSGQRDVQGAEGFLQQGSGACGQVVRPALGDAEHDGQIAVVKVVPEGQLDGLTLTNLQSGQDRVDQASEFGLPLVTWAVARTVERLADHAERHGRVGLLADHRELHRRVG